MRISMWMLANMLRDEDCIFDISQNAQENLFGAGFTESPGRVCIAKNGNDVICYSGDDRIILKSCSFIYAFERIQQIFDYYNEWSNVTSQLCREHNWQAIIDNMELMFPHPLVLYDTNMKVLAMSSRFGPGTVDAEWDYLINYGMSSDAAIKAGKALSKFSKSAQHRSYVYFIIPATALEPMFVSMNVRHFGESIAFISGVGIGMITKGQIESLAKLATIIDDSLPGKEDLLNYNVSKDIFKEFITNKSADDLESIKRRISVYGWDEADHYSLLCAYIKDDPKKELIHDLFVTSANALSIPIVVLTGKVIFVLNNDDSQYKMMLDQLMSIARNHNAITIESNSLEKIQNIFFCYDQIQFVLSKIDGMNKEHYKFYDFAIKYIILHSDRDELLHACNPSIFKLFITDSKSLDLTYSLEAYLKCDCSLQDAASVLYVHKNTISYRVRKALEIAQVDTSDMYSRSYAILSFDVLHALGY